MPLMDSIWYYIVIAAILIALVVVFLKVRKK
jgi:hypothetical protein